MRVRERASERAAVIYDPRCPNEGSGSAGCADRVRRASNNARSMMKRAMAWRVEAEKRGIAVWRPIGTRATLEKEKSNCMKESIVKCN